MSPVQAAGRNTTARIDAPQMSLECGDIEAS
jgi:hypothetical protein